MTTPAIAYPKRARPMDTGARLAAAYLVILAIAVALGPQLVPYDPARPLDIIALKNAAPSLMHPLGTDAYSRDVLSRVLSGARVSLVVALVAVAIAVTIGAAYGIAAGLAGGRADSAMMNILDGAMSTPRILLLLAAAALSGDASVGALVLILGSTGWFTIARLVRSEAWRLRRSPDVEAARALGASPARIATRHVLPSVMPTILVAATLCVAEVLTLEAGLSYLGLGVPAPAPSWGNIIRDGMSDMATAWWVAFFPGLALTLTVLALATAGEWLRVRLDPRRG